MMLEAAASTPNTIVVGAVAAGRAPMGAGGSRRETARAPNDPDAACTRGRWSAAVMARTGSVATLATGALVGNTEPSPEANSAAAVLPARVSGRGVDATGGSGDSALLGERAGREDRGVGACPGVATDPGVATEDAALRCLLSCVCCGL